MNCCFLLADSENNRVKSRFLPGDPLAFFGINLLWVLDVMMIHSFCWCEGLHFITDCWLQVKDFFSFKIIKSLLWCAGTFGAGLKSSMRELCDVGRSASQRPIQPNRLSGKTLRTFLIKLLRNQETVCLLLLLSNGFGFARHIADLLCWFSVGVLVSTGCCVISVFIFTPVTPMLLGLWWRHATAHHLHTRAHSCRRSCFDPPALLRSFLCCFLHIEGCSTAESQTKALSIDRNTIRVCMFMNCNAANISLHSVALALLQTLSCFPAVGGAAEKAAWKFNAASTQVTLPG